MQTTINNMRFFSLTDNTSRYFVAANNFPYGAPPKMEDNEMDYDEPAPDKVPEEFGGERLLSKTQRDE